jgi:hypothetical protein
MTTKEFVRRLTQIKDPGRLAGLKRIFGRGGSEISGLKILAQLGVAVSDEIGSIPYKIVGYIYGRGISHATSGSIVRVFRTAALAKEFGFSDKGELSFDRRFDAMVACRGYQNLQIHLVKIIPFLDDRSLDLALLLDDLLNWSQPIRDKWIELYYQS